VVQNSRLLVSNETSNKIFELLFALVLVDVGSDLVLDHPFLAKGDNPDILVTIDSKRWGFAFKTVYSQSPKTFFDNLKKGAQQIRASEAELGCVVVNFRNLIRHERFIPVLNAEEHAAGAEPEFGLYQDPMVLRDMIGAEVSAKEKAVRDEIGEEHFLRAFDQTKTLPGFAAFFQTCALKHTFGGPIPSDICSLGLAHQCGSVEVQKAWQDNILVFEKINLALHQRSAS
jgi:hypothetical protein